MKCIDDEIPFEVPETWKWCRLRNLILGTGAGKSPNCDKRPKKDNEWGVLTTTAIQYCDFLPNENKVLPTNYIVNEDQEVKYNDLLITRAGPRNRTGVVCVANKACSNLILSDKTVRIEYVRDYCNPYYLMFALNSPVIHDNVMSATVGMADSQVNISQNSIQNIAIPLPPYKEQENIVNKLNTVLPYLKKYSIVKEQQDKLNENISILLKKSILQEAIHGKLVAQDPNDEPASVLLERIKEEKAKLFKEGKLKNKDLIDSVIFKGEDNKYYETIDGVTECIDEEIPHDLPSNWVWTRLGNVAKMTIGKTPARGNQCYWSNGEYSWVSISDMKNLGVISATKERISAIAVNELMGNISPKGSLLMSFKLTVGRTSLLEIDAYHNEAIITVLPFIDECNTFRNYLFRTLPLLSIAGDSKDAIKGKTLNSQSLSRLLIPLPPISEQERIVNELLKFDNVYR